MCLVLTSVVCACTTVRERAPPCDSGDCGIGDCGAGGCGSDGVCSGGCLVVGCVRDGGGGSGRVGSGLRRMVVAAVAAGLWGMGWAVVAGRVISCLRPGSGQRRARWAVASRRVGVGSGRGGLSRQLCLLCCQFPDLFFHCFCRLLFIDFSVSLDCFS